MTHAKMRDPTCGAQRLATLSEPANESPSEDIFAVIADAIFCQGYYIAPAMLPLPVADALLAQLALCEAADFEPAGIGRGDDLARNRFVRRDQICWLDPLAAPLAAWHEWCDQLRLAVNSRLFLGLFDFESHLAVYRPGDFYQRHLDAFVGQSNRVLSLVSYLNRGWQPDQGGELVLFDPGSGRELVKVVPQFGTLVLFLSEQFPHEVRAAKRTRYSVAGWFRVNTSTAARVDPPH